MKHLPGSKDVAPDGQVPKSVLEDILKNEAVKATMHVYTFSNPAPKTLYLIGRFSEGYTNPAAMRKHCVTFLIDSYIFYRRHNHHSDPVELNPSESQWFATRDVFEYMLRLSNGFPYQHRSMVSQWRVS